MKHYLIAMFVMGVTSLCAAQAAPTAGGNLPGSGAALQGFAPTPPSLHKTVRFVDVPPTAGKPRYHAHLQGTPSPHLHRPAQRLGTR